MILPKKRKTLETAQRPKGGKAAGGFKELETQELEVLARARKELARPATRAAVSTPALFLAGVVILSLLSFLYLIQTSQVASLGYQIKQLESTQATLQRETSRLETEITRQESLDKVENIAATKLGMVAGTTFVYLHVPASASGDGSAGTDQQGKSSRSIVDFNRLVAWATGAAEAGER